MTVINMIIRLESMLVNVTFRTVSLSSFAPKTCIAIMRLLMTIISDFYASHQGRGGELRRKGGGEGGGGGGSNGVRG